MGDTTIAWTDKTWNPTRGCSIVSAGCRSCYAMKQAHRFSGPGKSYEGLTKMTAGGPVWTGEVRTVPTKLHEPLHWKNPVRIFVDSMSDLFHEDVPEEFILEVWGVMAKCPQHTFQILTKRADRMMRLVREFGGYDREGKLPLSAKYHDYAENVWLGVSIENRAELHRVDALRLTPAAVRFISAEPLLESLGDFDLTGISQVIIGGESGSKARPFDIAWARSTIAQCKAAGVPVFCKQLGAHPIEWEPGGHIDGGGSKVPLILKDRAGSDPSEWSDDLNVREFPK